MAANGSGYSAYKQVDVETASQGKLIVLLFNGAIQRAEEAKRLMQCEPMDIGGVHNKLVRAQDIISELRGALNLNMGEVAVNLDRSYEYFHHLLVQANLKKDPSMIDECVELMTIIRDTWEEVFQQVAENEILPPETPTINPHGASVLNIQS
jgi:flagellar protein FliS